MVLKTDLIHPEIWQRAYPAIQAARSKAHNYLKSGGWCLQHDVPTVKVNDQGWPWLSIDQFRQDRPPRLSSLFGEKAPNAYHFSHTDVPEIAAFYTYCRSRSDLTGTLLPPDDSAFSPLRDLFIDRLLFGVMERSEAVNASSETEIRGIYAEAEKSIFQPALPAELVVPVAQGAFELDEPWIVANNIRIEPLDEPNQRARATQFTVGVHIGVLNAATHAIVADGVVLDNTSPWIRCLSGRPDVVKVLSQVEQLLRALRVLTSMPLGYAQILLRPHGWADRWTLDLPPLNTVDEVRRYPDILENRFWLKKKRPILQSQLEDLPLVFRAISQENKRLNLAARRLEMATMRPSADDKVIDCSIGFEALLGGGDKTEVTHKLALRAATLLSEKSNVSNVYAAIRSIYSRRSEIVHGSDKHKYRIMRINDIEVDAAEAAIMLLQRIIKTIAVEGVQVDPAHLDGRLLEALSAHASTRKSRPESSQTDGA